MKALLCAVTFVFLATYSYGQKIPHIYQIRADTVRIYNTCDTAEFVLENRTKDTLGFLFNKGKGRTEFSRLNLQRIGASQLAIKGQDTIDLNFASYGDTRYDLLSTNFITITPGDSLTFSQWPNLKVVGYDAYNSPDMPALSNQAIKGLGNKLYYNGLVVRDGNSGFDLAINWDGELDGPNGAFLRSKDDTRSAWSKWRELLFKDYADTTYAPKNTETLQSVTARGNSTSQNILFGGTPASSAGLSWNFNTDIWKIFVESPQDTPAGDMIFESADNDQEGWIFRSKNGTTPKQVLSIQPEGTFTFLGNNILHAGNHAAGSAFTPTLTGANVLSTITTNASGHVTALTTRALTAADIGAAPATTSGNYIQNLSTGAQVANFSISGTGNAGYGFSTPLVFSNNSAGQLNLVGGATGANSLRGGEIVLLGGSWGTTPGEIIFRTGTGGSGAQQPERMRIDAAGNVGVNNSNPSNTLHVTGASSTITASTITTYATRISQGGSDLGIGGDASYSYIQSFNSKPLQINNVGNNVLINAVGGNVGIGTISPVSKLAVNGATTSSYFTSTNGTGNTIPHWRLQAGALNRWVFTLEDMESSGNAGSNLSIARYSDAGAIIDKPFTLKRSTGFIGIGQANPSVRLEVLSDLGVSAGDKIVASFQRTTGTAARGIILGYYANGTSETAGMIRAANNGNIVLAPNGGNIGIGNAAPSQRLEVNGAIRANGGNVQCGPTDASVLSALTYTTGMGVVGSFTNSPFAVYTNSTEKLRVDAAGNVGIGVTAPTSKLHVAGAGLFTGQVQATSFFQSSLRSLKKDIQPFTASALDIFKKVQVRTFKFKADTTGKTNIGFIADEVPNEMATPQRNGVDQASTVALLVKAVQELTEQNKALQDKISKLEAKMKEK